MSKPKTGLSQHVTHKLPRWSAIALTLFVLMLLPSPWAASQTALGKGGLPRLSYAGTEIAAVTVNSANVNFRVVVDLAGDRPMATYMAIRPRGMRALQRTATGAWVAWDQQPQHLIDNRFQPSAGHLVFPVTGANFTAQSFPIALEVAYRMPAGVKFGVLSLTPKR